MTKNILNVLYQSNDHYAMVSGTSIVSLLENNNHLDEVNIFYCDYEITKGNRNKLHGLVGKYKNGSIQFIDAKKYHKTLGQLKVKPWHGFYITWLKLLAFGDLDLKTDRVLFINGHTIINGPLDELIELDFEDAVMALSYDCLLNEHKKTIGLSETDGYYNCGIMLINHKKWVDEDLTRKLKEHLMVKSDYVIADQDLCNVLFKNQIKTLSSTYNFSSAYYAYNVKTLLKINNLKPSYFYSYEALMEDYYSPKIIHSLFGIKGKPWEEGNEHPQRFLWKKYIAMTPWKDTKRPTAKRSLNWFLYDILPSSIFMRLYKIAIRRMYGL
jgi:lipopolysaccharide biosynthesis glycosyltransferase